jgi:uncharacterized protein (TIGR03083 family)
VAVTAFDREAQLGALWRDGLNLADAAERAGLEARVAPCPDWAVRDLVWHVGEVHDFWRSVVREGWTDPGAYAPPSRPDDASLLGWYRAGVQASVEALSAASPDLPVWSWAPRGGNAAWVVRRMAQETAVHRWDAEHAAGSGWSIDPDVATDGVDEFLEHFSDYAAEGAAGLGGTVHLHATDGDGEWLVSEPVIGGQLEFSREHTKGDAAVRGTASDLLLLLWRRAGLDDPGRFEVFGDADVARRLVARADLH